MFDLNQLSDNTGARKNRMRVGRGIGSGKGKTCGRGVKGQKARTGVAIRGFEGGQMPIFRRLPKRGFTNIHRQEYSVINIENIDNAILAGHLSKDVEITAEVLAAAGLIRSSKLPVKLLGKGSVSTSLNFSIATASKKAKEIIEQAGGRLLLSNMATN